MSESDMSFVQKSKKDIWQTPRELWKPINERDPITLDPCAGENTSIGELNYSLPTDGLAQDWGGTVWLNPPFSQKEEWFEKAREDLENCETIYIVTPDSTNVQSWWHGQLAEFCKFLWFPDGRINYINPQTDTRKKNVSFGTAINIAGELNQEVKEWFNSNGDLMKRYDY
jgi:phage N-6-adenine-methyltransferase